MTNNNTAVENTQNTNASKTQSLLKAAWIIAFVTIISKLIGFLRDVVIANFYGAGMVSDAYFYAYQIPAISIILLGGIGGPFHSAVVSVFSKLIPNLEQKPSDAVNKLFNTFLTSSFLMFLALGVLVFVFSDVIMKVIIANGSPELIHLASVHLKIMAPVLTVGGVVGIYYGILIVYKEFLIPNISPILMSVAIIAIISLVRHDNSGVVLALATTVGALCQFVYQLPKLKSLGFKFRPNLDVFNNPQYKNILELLFPAILSSTVGQVYIYVDMFFASQLQEGAWSAIGYANRLFQFPVGVLVTAFLVPLFPIFSKLVGEKDYDNIRYYFNKGVGLLNFVAFPILVLIILLSTNAIQLIFQRGAFNEVATMMVSEALCYLSISIIFYVFRDSITRVFYAFNDSKTPFLVALSSIVIKFILNFLFVKQLGIGGITLSTSFVTLINGFWLGLLIKKKMSMDYGIYFKNLLKMAVISVATYYVCLGVYRLWDAHIAPTQLTLIVKITLITLLCFAVYSVFAAIVRIPYVFELYGRAKGKLMRFRK
ncbi:tll2350 protein [Clostridium sp. CAG:306]|nr:tll2350 protein [Clostridium sp. CAG:306]